MTKIISIKSTSIRVAPSKFQKILKQIRGKTYIEALSLLKYFPQKAGTHIWKLLKSLISNAVHNYNLNKELLIISEAFVNKSFTLKRMHPRAKGRAFKIEKKSSFITLSVKEKLTCTI